jgi:hypothetical protein
MNDFMKILGPIGQAMTFDQIRIKVASPRQVRPGGTSRPTANVNALGYDRGTRTPVRDECAANGRSWSHAAGGIPSTRPSNGCVGTYSIPT